MCERKEKNEMEEKQIENSEQLLSSLQWKEICQKSAEVINGLPSIKRLKLDYLIEINRAGLGLVISIILKDKDTMANTILFKTNTNGQTYIDEVLDNTVRAFEDGVLHGRLIEREQIMHKIKNNPL